MIVVGFFLVRSIAYNTCFTPQIIPSIVLINECASMWSVKARSCGIEF